MKNILTDQFLSHLDKGDNESLSKVTVTLVPEVTGGNRIYADSAQRLIKSVLSCLIDLRNQGELQLNIKAFTENLSLSKLLDLAERTDIDNHSLRGILRTIGWQPDKDRNNQPKSLTEQFGYSRSVINLELLTSGI